MFSSRTEWDLSANKLTILLRRKHSGGEVILDLTESNPTRCNLELPELYHTALGTITHQLYDPSAKGTHAARIAISRFYQDQGTAVNPDSIILTSSTSEGYSFLFRLLGNPGDHFLVPRPSYPLFETLTALHDLQIEKYDLLYDGEWHVDRDSVVSAVSAHTKGIIIVHPSNPAGAFVAEHDREFLLSLASQRKIPLLIDEVFQMYTLDSHSGATASFVGESTSPVAVLNGLAKLAGLPQMKLAWIVVNGPEPWRSGAVDRLEVISDAFLSVSSVSQILLPTILGNIGSFTDPIRARVRTNFAYLNSAVKGGISVLHIEGGWNAMIRIPSAKSDEEWALDILETRNVLVHPGYLFDCRTGDYIVVSLLPRPDLFQEAVARIISVVASA